MKLTKEDIKAIFLNIISTALCQIISWVFLIVCASGIVYKLLKVFNSLKNRTISVSVFDFIVVIGCILVISFAVFILKLSRKKKSDEADKNIEEDYYFTDYEKHITIYRNGHGIIIHDFTVVVNDIDKFYEIRRSINIHNGAKTSGFPSLDTMQRTDKHKRFSEYGFWYQSEDNIIQEVKEFYWDNIIDPSREDIAAKSDPKKLKFIFTIDKDKLVKGKSYRIRYIISIPGLAALDEGRLNRELMENVEAEKSYSSMKISHNIKHLTYILSFEEGIDFKVLPKCKHVIPRQDKPEELDIDGAYDYNLLYQKYIFDIYNPVFGSNIVLSWKYNVL